MLAPLLKVGSSFVIGFSDFLNIRCTFADTFLKETLKLYDAVIEPSIVSFHFQSKNEEPEKLTEVNDTYRIKNFDPTKPTRVIIHGFWNSHNSRINKSMKKIYLSDFDVNLIIVNYSRISRDYCYKIARGRVGMLGRKIAKFLDKVLGRDEWQWTNLILVGHSLGAHTAGGKI